MTDAGSATPGPPAPGHPPVPPRNLPAPPHHPPAPPHHLPAPPPPPGPGVQPPFVAPPTDGARQRRWLAVGLSVAAALILCVGGLFGLGGLFVFGSQMILDQARTAVTDYLTAVQNEEYGEAYAQLCDSRRARVDETQFRRSFANKPGITSFTVGDPILTSTMVVPASVRFEDGTADAVRYLLEQDTSTGEFEVCGEEG